MKQRQAAHHHVVRPDLAHRPHTNLGIAAQIAVGEHGALGLTGGAGGVQDDGGVIVVALHRGALLGQVGGQVRQLGVIDDPALNARLPGARHGLLGGGRSRRSSASAALLDR